MSSKIDHLISSALSGVGTEERVGSYGPPGKRATSFQEKMAALGNKGSAGKKAHTESDRFSGEQFVNSLISELEGSRSAKKEIAESPLHTDTSAEPEAQKTAPTSQQKHNLSDILADVVPTFLEVKAKDQRQSIFLH